MALPRERLYSQFNFHVFFSTANQQPDAAFQEITGLQQNLPDASTIDQSDNPRKITGTYKVGDVTLKRGVIGELGILGEWLQQVKDGHERPACCVDHVIQREPATGAGVEGARGASREIHGSHIVGQGD